nr:DUF5688 family protein [uncultured Blautia sp.]
MDFEKFVEEVKSRITDFLPEKYANTNIFVREQEKINSNYTGLMVELEGRTANPTINLERFYEEYQNGQLMEDVLYDIAKIVQMERPEVDVSRLADYDKVKDSLFIRVCNSKENEELLKNVPHVEIEDMAVTCHILVAKDKIGISSTTVTNDMLKSYGMREEQLINDALESSPRVNPPEIVNMDELMEQIYREQFTMMGYNEDEITKMLEDMPRAEIPMIVVTNEDRVNGAATMFYPGVMDEIGEKLNSKFFVLPSSLHETIVVLNDGNMEYKSLLAMVTEINATQVDTQDKLTDQVYHYDVTDKVFEKASRYEDRKQEKEKSHEKKSVLEKLEEKKDESKTFAGTKKTPRREDASVLYH